MRQKNPFLVLFLGLLVIIPTLFWSEVSKNEIDDGLKMIKEKVGVELLDNYPDDLELEINKGEVSINRDLPYCLILGKNEKGSNFGVVFDKEVGASEWIKEKNKYSNLCQSVGLVGDNYVVYPDDKGYKTQKIGEEINFKINKEKLSLWIEKYFPIVEKVAMAIFWIVPFLLVLLTMSWFLIKNLWYGICLKLASKIFKIKDLNWGDAYKTSLWVFMGWSLVSFSVGKVILSLTEKTVALSPFVFFNTLLITALSLYLIRKDWFKFEKKVKKNDKKRTGNKK